MAVEVSGALKGHTVTVDAESEWPTVHITCLCGWSSTVNAEEGHALKDAIARVTIHTGGPVLKGMEGVLYDENLLRKALAMTSRNLEP